MNKSIIFNIIKKTVFAYIILLNKISFSQTPLESTGNFPLIAIPISTLADKDNSLEQEINEQLDSKSNCPQISEKKDEPLVLINPVLKKVIDPELKTYSEGCLSVPGFYEELERPSEIEISFQDLKGQDQTLIANGLLSVVIQHEMDHLEGKMMVDSVSNVKREMIRKKLSKAKGT